MDRTLRAMATYGVVAVAGFGAGLVLARRTDDRVRTRRPRAAVPLADPADGVAYITGYIRGYEDGESRAAAA